MKKFILVIILAGTFYFCYDYYKSGKFNNYLEQNPDSVIAQGIEYYMGYINYIRRNYGGAIFRFNRVINNYKVENYKSKSYYHIALCYEEQNCIPEAIKVYKFLYMNYPNSYEGNLAKKRFDYLLSTRNYAE